MLFRLQFLSRKLALIEKLFLAFLPVSVLLRLLVPGSPADLVLTAAAYFSGAAVAYRWARIGMKRMLWRLRYRLVIAYLYIAGVPIVLLLALAGFGAWILTGQIAVYMVTTELDRRAAGLLNPARGLAAIPPGGRIERARWLAPYLRERYAGFEMVIRDRDEWRYPEHASLGSPPQGWGETSGLVWKSDLLYLWAHAVHGTVEVTMTAPMTREAVLSLVPNLDLGQIAMIAPTPGQRSRRIVIPSQDPQASASHPLPPPHNPFDREVAFLAPLEIAVWNDPGATRNDALLVDTRYSAVLRKLFGQKAELSEGYTAGRSAAIFTAAMAGLFFVFETVSLLVGIRITRQITGAVHNLYEGTARVREGDFSHRINVQGKDQLSELSHSFNRMTENLERLVAVAKEKERLQSELEIAREVQNQLYPKSMPESHTLQLAAACQPARLVSGDYYDYLGLHGTKLALAIGDVAGKGISAALLMATVQSTMRTQLRAGRELAAAAGNGGSLEGPSTAALVSRLNQQLYAYTPPEKFATFYFAIYDDASGLLTYTNAGHLPPVLLRNGTATRLDVNGTVVGAFPFSPYEESTVQLERGDLLVCFTDGVTEPENEYGEMFGEDRLVDLLARNRDRDSEELMATVMASVREWTGSPELQDDMTMLVARRS
jgi:sigma-B regulation protein RsbU (phosphoserine phosphatase)